MIQDITKHYAVGDVVACERNGRHRLKAEVIAVSPASITFGFAVGPPIKAVRAQGYADGRVLKMARSLAYEFWPVKHSVGKAHMLAIDAAAAAK